MLNKNNWLKPWFRFMAKQLRKPTGFFARLTGNKMNETNEQMYIQVFDSMDITDGNHILDIGFGNGRFFSNLYSRAKNLRLTGIEMSPEMVKEAIKNNRNLVESGMMKVETGSSDNLPFADNSFDKIFCINVIYFWDSPGAHLQEIRRVLKPGGKFYIGFRPAANMLQMPFTQYGFNLFSEDDWKNIITKNGFIFSGLQKKTGSEIKMNRKKIVLESVCIFCEK